MKLRTLFVAAAFAVCGSLCAQNATKAEVDELKAQVSALSQKVSALETAVERVMTENVNLVEQLNVKTVTSVKDSNGFVWDIVKIETNDENQVLITLRITNNSGSKLKISGRSGEALDSNSNLSNNSYEVDVTSLFDEYENGFPKNKVIVINRVPANCTYLSYVQIVWNEHLMMRNRHTVRFTGVHIPR